MLFNDLECEGEAETRALALGAEERFNDAPTLFWKNPGAVVVKGDGDVTLVER